jgi:endoglucanase
MKQIKQILFYILFNLIFSSFQSFAQPSQGIQLNQVGFYPKGIKIAVVTAPVSDNRFYVISAKKKDTVYRGVLTTPRLSKYSSTIAALADFTPFHQSGKFFIYVPSVGYSYLFNISKSVLKEVAKGTIKGFYFQRMSMPLEERFAGKWARPEGHPDTIVFIHSSAATEKRPEGSIISSPGGWYDAGDYNKYIVNSGITMGTLFSAYEDFRSYFKKLSISIPESKNEIPDILDEALYNLRWMLTMQDPNDGGVYHKCTNASFDAMIMPDKATKPRYVVQKSTAATLDFVAVMSQAARIFRSFNKQLPGLSDSCIIAAKKAWQWALKNNAVIYNQRELNNLYKPPITTGEYGDQKFNDEFLWAASELFITTKDTDYLELVKNNIQEKAGLPSWSNVTLLAYYSFIRFKNNFPGLGSMINSMQDTIINLADNYILNAKNNAFGVVMGQSVHDFIWGSNAVAANESIVLLNAWLIKKDPKYIDAALGNLDYILGRNATGYCFVTGFGSRSTMHPHHRPSVADGIADPVPGLMAGGPNPGQQDKCPYPSKEPELSYSDSDCAYASNEVAINWNAPLVYLVNAIEFLEDNQ